MLLSFIYIITVILLLITFILIKKSDKELNIIKWIITSLVLEFCFNTCIAYILNLIGIPINLLSLSICNLIPSFIFLYFILIGKKKQKYYYNKKDIIISLICSIIILIICFLRFGFPLNIAYESVDSGVHYLSSLDFYNNSNLLNKADDIISENLRTRQFASYMNVGILFKIMSPFIDKFDFYKLYIIYDIFMLILSGLAFYVLIDNEKKNIPNIIIVLGVLLYVLGYPLNSMIFGFLYLSHALVIVSIFIYLYKTYFQNLLNKYLSIFLLSIILINILFTYSLFVPIIGLTIIAHKLYNSYKLKDKILTKENIIFIISVFLIPLIMWLSYCIIPDKGGMPKLTWNGFSFVDIINSILLFLPLVIFSIINDIKKKKLSFISILFIVTFIAIIFGIILIYLSFASVYYLSKFYYLLWLIIIIISFKYIFEFYEDKKIEINAYLVFILSIIILSISNIQSDLKEKTDPYAIDNYYSVFYIYKYNLNNVLYPNFELTNEEMNDLKKLYKDGITIFSSNAKTISKYWMLPYFNKRIDYTGNPLLIYEKISENAKTSEEDIAYSDDKYNVLFTRKNILHEERLYDETFTEYYIYETASNNCSSCKFTKYDTFILIEK